MVTSIFAAHGYNTSRGVRDGLADGSRYWTYEWPEVKRYFKRCRVKGENENGKFFTYANPDEFHGLVKSLPKPWVIKCGVNMWPLFAKMPVTVVKVRRNSESIARSMAAKKRQGYEETLAGVKEKEELFNLIPGFEVSADELIAGDFSSLIPAFRDCGVRFDPALAATCIDPNQWHYGERSC